MKTPNTSVVTKGRQKTAALFFSLLVATLGLFTTPIEAQVNVPNTFVLPSSAADASKRGFIWRIHQLATAQANNNDLSDAELAGLLGDNIANPAAQGIAIAPAAPASPSTAPIQFEIGGVINLSVFAGQFNGSFGPDDQMPGLPNAVGGYENAAAEILAWLDLPAGVITLGVNSDDGFRMSLGGSNPKDQFTVMAGEFNGGRGAADTLFSINVAQAGLYAMRCTWEQGCCDGNIEIFSFDNFGNRVLLNDAANGGIKAYRAVTSPPRAYARRISPRPGTSSVRPDAPIVVELVDGASAINPATVKIAVDGVPVSITRPKSGNVTTATYTPPSLYAPGSQHSVAFSYTEGGSPVTVNWVFNVENYVGPTGNFYEFVYASGISWESAKAAAEQRTFCQAHGHLATITSADEDVYLELLRQQYVASGVFGGEAWVGGFQPGNQAAPGEGWMWINGEGPIAGFNGGPTYANWLGGEPNDCCTTYGLEDNEENYLSIGNFNSFGWNDEYGASTRIGGYVVEYERLVVPIDIKPDGSPNPINLDANGKLPVAILSTATFDANTVDPSTVRFGRTGIQASPVKYSLEDVNRDGRKDLVCQFEIEDIGMMCGDVSGQLTATTFGGCPIKGSDSVQILHCPPYALSIQAMQDIHKVADVYLKVNVILAGHTAPSLAQSIQLKSSDIFGHQKWTKNFQNTALSLNPDNTSAVSFRFPDMEHGQNVKAKMNVKEGGAGPTQVLRQEGRVLYRPDLAVMNVLAPSQANVRQIVNITAAVRELKGDLGATANVYLMDGNTVIDFRNGVSLAPLGDASVTFAAVFSEGVHQLKVLIGDVTPGDYDLSNNERSFSILVIKPPLEPVSYYASYGYYDQDYQNVVENPFWISTYHDHYTNESTSETLYIPVAFQFPLSRVVLKIASDGVERNSFEILNIPQSYGYSSGCYTSATAFFYLDNNTYMTVQSDSDCSGYQQTYASFNRSAGGEVYFSAFFDKVFPEGSYTNSHDYASGTFLSPLNSVETRFIVEGDAGAFGGNGNVGTIYIAPPYGSEWDYFEYDYKNGLNDQHNTGFYRVNNVYGNNSGVTIP